MSATLATASLNRAAVAILGGGSPATIYAALITGASNELTGGTEASGTSYARASITNSDTNFPAPTTGVVTLANAFSFPESGAAWSSSAAFNCVRFYDAPTAGNLLAGSLIKDTAGSTITFTVTGAGQTVTIPASGIVLTMTSA
jgi:hypothetical protein